MAVKSVYVPDAARKASDGQIVVTGEEHRHLRVSRTGGGEPVEVIDGKGGVWSGVVTSADRGSTRIELDEGRRVPPPSAEVILGVSLIRTGAFEWALEKAVELGATRIVPLRAARSNESGNARDRRWQRIVLEATKQSKQYWVPDVGPVVALEAALGIEARSRIILSERGGGRIGPAVKGSPVVCLVGPEGGWTDGEIGLARDAGFSEVHLMGRILRAETAVVVGLGLIASKLGVL